jgi:hypothetical protein
VPEISNCNFVAILGKCIFRHFHFRLFREDISRHFQLAFNILCEYERISTFSNAMKWPMFESTSTHPIKRYLNTCHFTSRMLRRRGKGVNLDASRFVAEASSTNIQRNPWLRRCARVSLDCNRLQAVKCEPEFPIECDSCCHQRLRCQCLLSSKRELDFQDTRLEPPAECRIFWASSGNLTSSPLNEVQIIESDLISPIIRPVSI